MRQARPGISVTALLFGVAAVLAACDPQVRTDLVGVRRLPPNRLEVFYRPCPGELVASVEFLAPEGNIVGDEDETRYWRIESDGAPTYRFVVGQTPEGFSESVSLRSVPPSDSELAILIDTNLRPSPGVFFQISELKEASVLSGSGYSSLEGFLASDPGDCPN